MIENDPEAVKWLDNHPAIAPTNFDGSLYPYQINTFNARPAFLKLIDFGYDEKYPSDDSGEYVAASMTVIPGDYLPGWRTRGHWRLLYE